MKRDFFVDSDFLIYLVIKDPHFLLLVKIAIIIFITIVINNIIKKTNIKLRVETFFLELSIPYKDILRENIIDLGFKIVDHLNILPKKCGKY